MYYRIPKCIAAPPGMAAITLSDDAWAAADKVDSHTFYLDMQAAKKVETKIRHKLHTLLLYL